MKLELLQAIHNGKQVFSETEAGGVEAFQPKADALQELADERLITVDEFHTESQTGTHRVTLVVGCQLTGAGRAYLRSHGAA